MQKQMIKNEKGITLVAMVITVIIMLILLGVTVTVSLNGGLFNTTKNAVDQTELYEDKQKLQEAVLIVSNLSDTTKLQSLLTDWIIETDGLIICTSPQGNRFLVNSDRTIQIAETKYEKD